MKTLLSLLIFLTLQTHAVVWHAENTWTQEWEEQYSLWITSKTVHPEIFVSKKSKYYGIAADCADAAYALRAIFSFENSLPFAIKSPSGSRNNAQKYFSNEGAYFDKYTIGQKRLIAFINYLGESVGSENLSHNDTYSTKLSSIRPSTLFTYKIKARRGKVIRHVYTIKEVTENGNFDLIYSTQAIKKEKLPLNYRKGKALSNKPHDVWGFKRFIWPSMLYAANADYPQSFEYDPEQFQLAKTMPAREFFVHVKNLLKTVDENANGIIKRSLKNLCQEASSRVKYVAQGVSYNQKIGGRCMNYREYDIYSTPARDKALKAAYSSLTFEYDSLIERGEVNLLSPSVRDLVDSTLNHSDSSLEATNALKEFCPISYRAGLTMNLGQLYIRQNRGLLSSHPNDNLGRRWGEKTGRKTKCLAHY